MLTIGMLCIGSRNTGSKSVLEVFILIFFFFVYW